MCNLSLGVEERGLQKGVSKTINNYIDYRRRSHTSIEEIKRDLKVLIYIQTLQNLLIILKKSFHLVQVVNIKML